MTYRMNQADRSVALVYMWKRWPDAHSMRYEGKCDNCRKPTLWSCQLEGDDNPSSHRVRGLEVHELCGYFCTNCKFSNAGSRPVVDHELDGK